MELRNVAIEEWEVDDVQLSRSAKDEITSVVQFNLVICLFENDTSMSFLQRIW